MTDSSFSQDQPVVSVIFCVNRSNPYLSESIKSVLEQTYEKFEFLIGANACSDEFFEELTNLAIDPRIKLFRTQLPQLAFTLNFLIEHATSDLLVRMDSDDICEPKRLERLVNVAINSTADVIGSWATLIDENNKILGYSNPPQNAKALKNRMIYSSPVIHPTVLFRKRFWIESRGYLGGFVSEDFDLWLRGISRGATIINIPECLLRYRIHSLQVSRSRLGYAETAAHWYREFLLMPNLYNACGWLVSSAKAVLIPTKNWINRTLR